MKNRKYKSLALGLIAAVLFAATISASVFMPAADVMATESAPSVWDGTSDTSFYTFSSNTLYIHSAAQLKAFADLAANGFTYEGFTIKLMADIDLNGNEWYPVNGFAGIFDGNGHTIKNFVLNRVGIGDLGFFGTITKIVTIKNLTLEDVISAADGSQVANHGFGILLGTSTASGTQILNCSVKNALITKWGATTDAGGAALLIGQSTGSIKIDGCSIVSSAMTELSNQGYAFGGIIGRIQTNHYNSVISNCSVYNTIITNYKSNGATKGYIAGQGSKLTVSNFKTNMINYCGKIDSVTGRFDISQMGFNDKIINSVTVPNAGEAIGSAYDKLTYINNTPAVGPKVTVAYTDTPWITEFNINGENKYADICAAKGAYTFGGNIGTISIVFPIAWSLQTTCTATATA